MSDLLDEVVHLEAKLDKRDDDIAGLKAELDHLRADNRALNEMLDAEKIAAVKAIKALMAELDRLRTEVAEWRQVAKVEAKLRREFCEEADRLRADLAQMQEANELLKEALYRVADHDLIVSVLKATTRTAKQNREGE